MSLAVLRCAAPRRRVWAQAGELGVCAGPGWPGGADRGRRLPDPLLQALQVGRRCAGSRWGGGRAAGLRQVLRLAWVGAQGVVPAC